MTIEDENKNERKKIKNEREKRGGLGTRGMFMIQYITLLIIVSQYSEANKTSVIPNAASPIRQSNCMRVLVLSSSELIK